MIICWMDGRNYSGKDALEVVERMRLAGLFTAGKTTGEYMRGVAARLRRLNPDAPALRHDTPENFVSDLMGSGMVRTLVTH